MGKVYFDLFIGSGGISLGPIRYYTILEMIPLLALSALIPQNLFINHVPGSAYQFGSSVRRDTVLQIGYNLDRHFDGRLCRS